LPKCQNVEKNKYFEKDQQSIYTRIGRPRDESERRCSNQWAGCDASLNWSLSVNRQYKLLYQRKENVTQYSIVIMTINHRQVIHKQYTLDSAAMMKNALQTSAFSSPPACVKP